MVGSFETGKPWSETRTKDFEAAELNRTVGGGKRDQTKGRKLGGNGRLMAKPDLGGPPAPRPRTEIDPRLLEQEPDCADKQGEEPSGCHCSFREHPLGRALPEDVTSGPTGGQQ